MSIRKALVGGLAASLMVLFPLSGVANAEVNTAPGHNKLKCFDGTTDGGFGGICKLKGHGAKGAATLDNTDSNPNGDYAGVYTTNSTLNGKTLGAVKKLSYQYKGTTSPTPGDLSLNVPLDENGDGTTEAYAFIDAFYCPGHHGSVNAIKDAHCGIYVGGVDFYSNWAALVAAHPTWKVATDNLVFIIAERTPAEGAAFWTVNHVTLGKPGK